MSELCPSICWTNLTSALLAQLVRVQPGRPRAAAATSKWPRRKVVARIGPRCERPGDQLVGSLRFDESGELLGEEVRDRDVAARVGLGRRPDQAPALSDGDRFGDHRPSGAYVEAATLERRHLAEPHTGVGQEEDDEPVGLAVALGVRPVLAERRRGAAFVGQRFDLGNRQVALLGPDRAREVEHLRDVAGQPAVLDRKIEDQGEHPVNLADRGP